MKTKGKIRIVLGYILVAFQIIGMLGNAADSGSLIPPHPTLGYPVSYIIGYFLIGIIGLILLWSGYSAKSKSQGSQDSKEDL